MDKDDFTYNLRTMRDGIEEDYKTIEQKLKDGKYSERIASANTATTLNYYQLSLQRRSAHVSDPTVKDYENTADGIQLRKDQLEADIRKDIEKEFEDKNLIEQQLEAYFYDEPSRDRAREHLYHPAKTAFNEKSEKNVSQIFMEQVGQKVQAKRDQAILQDAMAKEKEKGLSKESDQQILTKNLEDLDRYTFPELEDPAKDIPELEVHDFDPNEFVQQDNYPAKSDYGPSEAEPLDFSDDSSSSKSTPSNSDPKGPSDPEPSI